MGPVLWIVEDGSRSVTDRWPSAAPWGWDGLGPLLSPCGALRVAPWLPFSPGVTRGGTQALETSEQVEPWGATWFTLFPRSSSFYCQPNQQKGPALKWLLSSPEEASPRPEEVCAGSGRCPGRRLATTGCPHGPYLLPAPNSSVTPAKGFGTAEQFKSYYSIKINNIKMS